MSQQPPFDPNRPSTPNQPPFQGQPQFQPGQYPPVPQQGYPQGQYPPQGYQQFPQQPGQFQGYPPQGFQQQPAPQPKKKRRTGLIIVGVIVALLVFGCIGASLAVRSASSSSSTLVSSGSTSKSTGSTSATQAATTAPTQASTYKVGDTVKVGDAWDVTIVSAKTDPGTQIFTPKSGMTYLVFTLAMKNLTTENHTISSIIQFTLRSDDGTKYDDALYAPDGTTAIDGDVDGGQPAKGVISYEVPTNIHTFRLTFESVISPGEANWTITD